jgi:amino acid transporter
MSLWWFGWSGTVFLSSTRVIFAAAFDRMLPEWVSKVEPRTRTPVNALLLMVIPSIIISILYAHDIFDFQTLALDATLVIAVTFLGSTLAAILLPWKLKDVFEGSPISKMKAPDWLSWLVMILFAVGAGYLIKTSADYGVTVLDNLFAAANAGAIDVNFLTWLIIVILAILTIINVVMLFWIAFTVLKKLLAEGKMPLITLAGLVFLFFLDWLLVEWIWDPYTAPFDFPLYAIGWSNVSSMVFMFLNYALAAAIFYGFNAYRRREGIDISKVYEEIPVE